jgi:hypothetical protein
VGFFSLTSHTLANVPICPIKSASCPFYTLHAPHLSLNTLPHHPFSSQVPSASNYGKCDTPLALREPVPWRPSFSSQSEQRFTLLIARKQYAPVPKVLTSSKSLTDNPFELPPSSLFLGSCAISSGGSGCCCSLKCDMNCFSCSIVSGETLIEGGGEGDEEW